MTTQLRSKESDYQPTNQASKHSQDSNRVNWGKDIIINLT